MGKICDKCWTGKVGMQNYLRWHPVGLWVDIKMTENGFARTLEVGGKYEVLPTCESSCPYELERIMEDEEGM